MSCSDVLTYGDPAATAASERERLILEHLPQVRWIALRLKERLPESFALDDLISTGVLGLIAAVDNYDPSFNVKLATYAEYKIRGAILDSIRGQDGVPAHKRKKLKQLEAGIQAAEQRLQRAPELKVTLSEYQDWLMDVQALTIGSLDVTPDNCEGGGTLLSYIPDSEENVPGRQFEREELEELLVDGIQKMPEIERMVLNLYYMEEQSLKEIAEVMNLHLSRISQLKAQAVLRLRCYIERRWPVGRGIYST
ncbi:MAG: FliA/WhiG family RNA polymerase sigma factor [Acidobacteria bacterium]|nr:FliA/WhiG family RNA polymerase sigma factor [Acidobacteriota bacterium]